MNITFLSGVGIKKWDVILIASTTHKGIVIRVRHEKPGIVSCTVRPHKVYKKKLVNWVMFKILKIRVWIGDFYK